MKIISWNINGIRAVIKKGFLDFLKNEKPDILCLQEIKIDDTARNKENFDFPNYEEFWNSAERKGYSGTMILIKNSLKKEKSIFPYIDALATNIPLPSVDFHKISQPIILLEQEHENAGRIFDDINNLAQCYKPPADACNTYRLVLRELQELEHDLHIHIAQENYLLFPKAIKREQDRLQKC